MQLKSHPKNVKVHSTVPSSKHMSYVTIVHDRLNICFGGGGGNFSSHTDLQVKIISYGPKNLVLLFCRDSRILNALRRRVSKQMEGQTKTCAFLLFFSFVSLVVKTVKVKGLGP